MVGVKLINSHFCIVLILVWRLLVSFVFLLKPYDLPKILLTPPPPPPTSLAINNDCPP